MKRSYILFLVLLASINSPAQKVVTDTLKYKTFVAAPELQRSKFHNWLWGSNHRKEWATPVTVPVLWLNDFDGGLKPYKTGGGNETKTFHLRTSDGKEYALRSIRKSREKLLPTLYRNTFLEDIVKDGISLSHPYGAFGIPVILQSLGIYHAEPKLYYLPRQPALDTFNKKYGDNLYLLEERPDGDWSESDNLGHFKDFSKTEKVIDKLLEDNDNIADQYTYIKARLLDMLFADWDRHASNWAWGKSKTKGKKFYTPIPRDRDQAFFEHNGIIVDRIISAAGLGFMQNFDYKIKNIRMFSFESRDLDRFFANEMTRDDWINAAKNIQRTLTDAVISKSIHQLPPEIFAVSGNETIEKLKSRRNQLLDVAIEYYLFLAKEVDVTGSKKREYFNVTRNNSGETSISIFRMTKDGAKETRPYYKRIFKPGETKEIRIYGIDGADVYNVSGNSDRIKIRIIGSIGRDTVIQSGSKIYVYDDRNNVFKTTSARMHISPDSLIHVYKYDAYHYDKKGISPVIFYNHDDHLYVGLNYHFTTHKWRREPFATQQKFGINYSLTQQAFSATYKALYPKLIAGWDLSLLANYDAVRWTNFFGFGNETELEDKSITYYRMRSEEWLASAGLEHPFGKSMINVTAYFQRSKIINDEGRLATDFFHSRNPKVFAANNYAGARLSYSYLSVNDSIVPTKGFTFIANGSFTRNFTQKEFFQKYDARFQAYLPLSKKFSLAIRAGGATVVNNSADAMNNSLIYQYAVIGGAETLRGFRIERFWGKSSFYNTNELRFITDMKTYLMNGKFGVFGFLDDGRVWIPGENSNLLHIGYGGGILIAPFNYFCLSVTYGVSKETSLVQLRINKLF